MLDQMRARPDDAHVAEEHVPELRHLVDAQFAKPFTERINALVIRLRLPRFLSVVGTHRPEFVNLKTPVLHTGPGLEMEERAGGLNALRDPDDQGENGENDEHDR